MGRGTGEIAAADLDDDSEVAATARVTWDGAATAARRRASR
jgi:hypothetical protein